MSFNYMHQRLIEQKMWHPHNSVCYHFFVHLRLDISGKAKEGVFHILTGLGTRLHELDTILNRELKQQQATAYNLQLTVSKR